MASARGRGRGDQLAPAPEPRTVFPFPRMPFSEIQEDMTVYNHPVSREMLKAPTSQDAKGVYDFFVEEIYDKRPEDLAQPGFGCLEALDHQELYEDAIPGLQYMRECQKMFSAANFNEFGIRDIYAPDKVRFHWQISALINFAKFRGTRLESFEEMAKNADDLLEKERSVVGEKSELQREINTIEETRRSEESEVEIIRETVSEFGLELASLHKQQRTLTDQTREAKASLAHKTEHATSLKRSKTAEREEVERMQSRVVSSPDRVKGEIEDMREHLSAEKENVSSMESRTRVLKKRAEGLRNASEHVQYALNVNSDALASKQTLEALEHEVKLRQTKKSEFDLEVQSIQESRGHFERQVESIGTKVARVEEQRNDIDNGTSEDDQKLADRGRQLDLEREHANQLLKEKDEEATELQGRIEGSVTTFADEIEELVAKLDLVSERFTAYHRDITKVSDIISEDTQQALRACQEATQ